MTSLTHLPTPQAEALPTLDPALVPPSIMGPAVLTTAAMNGTGLDALAQRIFAEDTDAAARQFDLGLLYQLAFQRDEAMRRQRTAVAAAPVLRLRRAAVAPPAIRLLALMTPGDLMANTPLDFITNHLDVQLDLLFVTPGVPLPAAVPDHDLLFIAGCEEDSATMARIQALHDTWPRPRLNDPRFLPALVRERLHHLLAGEPRICCPPTVAIDRVAVEAFGRRGNGDVEAILPGGAWPILLRPMGTHAGAGLVKIDDPGALRRWLDEVPAVARYYLSRFVDYRGADGLFRKYRVGFVDRRPFLCHMAVSQNWMVHYLNAGMAESAEKRAEEAAAMDRFDAGFAARHAGAFDVLHRHLGFDWYSLDCAELPDGRLLVFEADTAAIVHLMDPITMYPYKHRHMPRVFEAFGAMLHRRRAQD